MSSLGPSRAVFAISMVIAQTSGAAGQPWAPRRPEAGIRSRGADFEKAPVTIFYAMAMGLGMTARSSRPPQSQSRGTPLLEHCRGGPHREIPAR